ncbi:chemotaxis protein [Neorhizobium lilium]|uniref:Chemotaxis protein n=1 Tax=Neorhizobium lilium TaxID=2503024 RepID=A0A444LFR3_9HYPH|nr:chemotaxis protein [Neorhizobium lilium]RWX77019.1 chemotaxis protein [Neorhizobium lilium]
MAADDLEPYKMMRSLQFIQDSIVMGDHSANEMQRFLLKTLDQRLRTIGPEAFKDTRNVDAVFMFAMSGGNPQTLEYLASRDIEGDFDSRLTRVLRRYLQGQGVSVLPAFDELVKEYGTTDVGPYLALVAGNTTAAVEPQKALGYFDQARLLAPGTNLEEAALRRSLAVALQISDFPRSLDLSGKYVRRFLYSPYASQFVDMFVQLIVDGEGRFERSQWADIVAMMDDERAKELYLRVARRALLAGKQDLARDASARAAPPAADIAGGGKAMGQLYGDLANISTAKVSDAVESISLIPDETLSERDKKLRDAARNVAEQILMPASLGAGSAPTPATDNSMTTALAPSPDSQPAGPQAVQADSEFKSYLDENRMKLKQIDDLLKGEARK